MLKWPKEVGNSRMRIGVLALQGSIQEHKSMLKKCGVESVEVRLPEDLKGIDGLIIPGGESTTIGKLMIDYGLDKEIKKQYEKGLSIYGTCAGAILLAKDIIGSKQLKLDLLDVSIKRNSYGRQIDSFETELELKDVEKPFKGIFIRAPVIDSIHNGVKVLSKFKDKPVLVQQKNLLASTFHPELTDDVRVHEYFVEMVRKACS
jgi:5'-phosphate synthase pdxT subunit|tara:strand:- start:3 stop:614 length:612 start_codon:yes stop_codon:yes gene_type:complete